MASLVKYADFALILGGELLGKITILGAAACFGPGKERQTHTTINLNGRIEFGAPMDQLEREMKRESNTMDI